MKKTGYNRIINEEEEIKMKKIVISPSVMCADLVNLEKSIKELEEVGIDTLHIDIIDGLFSPSMPLGIDTVKKLRQIN